MKERDTRQRIFEAALAVCAEHGYHGTRMDEIVRVAGVSKGGLYHHFKSKRELFLQLFDTLVDRTLEEAARHAPDATTEEALHTLFAGFDEWIQDERMVRGLMELNLLSLSDAEMRERFAASYRAGVAFTVSLLRRGVERGEVDPSLDVERVAWSMLPGADGLVFMHLLLGSFDRMRQALADYEELFLRAIAPRLEEPQSKKRI